MDYDIGAMEASFLDYVHRNVTLKAAGERYCQWTERVSGTVTAEVVEAQHDERGAVAADQMQIRAAEDVLALLSSYEQDGTSPAAQEALRQAAHILKLLGVPVTTLRDVVQYLRQRKVPGLYANLSKSRRGLLAAEYDDLAPTLPGSFHNLGEQLGDTSWLGDRDQWIAEAEDAGRRGDAVAEAAAWRKVQWWYRQLAERTVVDEAQASDYRKSASRYEDLAVQAETKATHAANTEAAERGRARAHELLFALRPYLRRIVDQRLGELL